MSYYAIDPWKIVENEFRPDKNRISESIFSIGNGSMGQRGNFEEFYSGDTLQGSYIGGVYYPDKTKVGWWKNGYPEYFAKVLNSVNWIGLNIEVEDEVLDLHHWKVLNFKRILDMKTGLLTRKFKVESPKGIKIDVKSERFISMNHKDLGALKYSITPINKDINISISSYLDGNITNKDSNYNEKFWINHKSEHIKEHLSILSETKKSNFKLLCLGSNSFNIKFDSMKKSNSSGFVSENYNFTLSQGKELILTKYAVLNSTFNIHEDSLYEKSQLTMDMALSKGWEELYKDHSDSWDKIWEVSDIEIVSDNDSAIQGVRYNIFQLNQTYTGEDSRLNVGPKGFTGEKYGGTTYWDTEAYCLPFYLGTKDQSVAKQLLLYRYNQLDKAIENAQKLGIGGGAALFPMVTINGEECHNEWEITFEEIHRNGAIAYAIYNYINITGDSEYLFQGGLEVLIAISRYWSKRASFSYDKQKYVILGVTGPNEYENNVNNNWYTNRIAIWTMEYTYNLINKLLESNKERIQKLINKLNLSNEEIEKFLDIALKIYLPEKSGIFLQQDGFLDKEIIPVEDIPKGERPLNQNWSWDRILRSCFIKQADVLQGIYFFEESFTKEEIKNNFDFYEPLTLHESSLSPCIHSIIASKLGYRDKAYELYLRTARLDLDNINNDTEDGCHITSMAGTWMSITYGFGGIRFIDGKLNITPLLPDNWDSLSFKLKFQNSLIKISITHKTIELTSQREIDVVVNSSNYRISDKPKVITI